MGVLLRYGCNGTHAYSSDQYGCTCGATINISNASPQHLPTNYDYRDESNIFVNEDFK